MATKKSTIRIVEVSLRKDRKDNPFAEITAAELKTFVGIKDAPALLGVAHALYARQLLHAGRIEGVKVAYKGYKKWLISPASIEYYTANKAQRTGKRRFTLKVDLDQEAAVRDALDAAGIEYDLALSYKKKS